MGKEPLDENMIARRIEERFRDEMATAMCICIIEPGGTRDTGYWISLHNHKAQGISYQ